MKTRFYEFCEIFQVSFFKKKKHVIIAASRGGSRTAATSKMERFVIIVNGWKPLTIITKRSILNVAAVLDPLPASDVKKYMELARKSKKYLILYMSSL